MQEREVKKKKKFQGLITQGKWRNINKTGWYNFDMCTFCSLTYLGRLVSLTPKCVLLHFSWHMQLSRSLFCFEIFSDVGRFYFPKKHISAGSEIKGKWQGTGNVRYTRGRSEDQQAEHGCLASQRTTFDAIEQLRSRIASSPIFFLSRSKTLDLYVIFVGEKLTMLGSSI